MSQLKKYVWTKHARKRWSERAEAMEDKDILLATARLAKRRVLNRITEACKQHAHTTKHGTWTGYHYLTNHGWIFVMAERTVITCFKLGQTNTVLDSQQSTQDTR